MQSNSDDAMEASKRVEDDNTRVMKIFWGAVIVFGIGLIAAIVDLSIHAPILELLSWLFMSIGVGAIIILLIVLPRLSKREKVESSS